MFDYVFYIKLVNSAYISGMVTIQSELEINAIDAPVDVSPPYAAGNTTVFSPNGVPKANNVRISVFLSAPKSHRIPTNSAGNTNNRRNVAI